MAGSVSVVALSGAASGLVTVSAGTQLTGLQLSSGVNVIATVTAANDGVTLPVGALGMAPVFIRNQAAANALTVFPPVGGTLNGGAVNAGSALVAVTGKVFYTIVTVRPLNEFYYSFR